MIRLWLCAAGLMLGLAGPVLADSVAARCDIYPRGSDHIEVMLGCRFSQRQGAVTIRRDDGVVYDLRPVGDEPGNYLDQHGQPAHRNSGLGTLGLMVWRKRKK